MDAEATRLLESIRDRLEKLPERLAELLAKTGRGAAPLSGNEGKPDLAKERKALTRDEPTERLSEAARDLSAAARELRGAAGQRERIKPPARPKERPPALAAIQDLPKGVAQERARLMSRLKPKPPRQPDFKAEAAQFQKIRRGELRTQHSPSWMKRTTEMRLLKELPSPPRLPEQSPFPEGYRPKRSAPASMIKPPGSQYEIDDQLGDKEDFSVGGGMRMRRPKLSGGASGGASEEGTLDRSLESTGDRKLEDLSRSVEKLNESVQQLTEQMKGQATGGIGERKAPGGSLFGKRLSQTFEPFRPGWRASHPSAPQINIGVRP